MKRFPAFRLSYDCRAVAAVEFALVCFPFVLFLMAAMAAGLNFYFQQVLDFSVQYSARQVQTGHVPSNYTQADFVNNVFCPNFGQLQACANVFIDLRPVTDYQLLAQSGAPDAPASSGTTGFSFCSGKPGQLMYLHVVYLPPSINWIFGISKTASAIVSNAAFENESPSGTTVTQQNGC